MNKSMTINEFLAKWKKVRSTNERNYHIITSVTGFVVQPVYITEH